MNRKLYWGLGVLIFLFSGGGVYLLAVQYTEILRREDDILWVTQTGTVTETFTFTAHVVFHALTILGQIGVLVGLVLLTIRTKSKGYLFFMGKGIGTLAILITIVYLKHNIGPSVSYAALKKTQYVLDILLTGLYIFGISLLYKEYTAKGVRNTENTRKR